MSPENRQMLRTHVHTETGDTGSPVNLSADPPVPPSSIPYQPLDPAKPAPKTSLPDIEYKGIEYKGINDKEIEDVASIRAKISAGKSTLSPDPISPGDLLGAWKLAAYKLSGEFSRATVDRVFSQLQLRDYRDGIVILETRNELALRSARDVHLETIESALQDAFPGTHPVKGVDIILAPPRQADANTPDAQLIRAENAGKVFTFPPHGGMNNGYAAPAANLPGSARAKTRRSSRFYMPSPFSEEDPLYAVYAPLAHPLLPRHRFDHFIIDDTNLLPHTVAKRAALDSESDDFSPLIFHGASGVGKTHLLQAIAYELGTHHPDVPTICFQANIFKHQFYMAIKNRDTVSFREMLRQFEVLIIDDLHRMRGQHRALEEIMNILDEFKTMGKRVYLALNQPLHELQDFPEALLTRLAGGMTLEIKAPGHALKLKALKLEAERLGLASVIRPEIYDMIVQETQGGVRELYCIAVRMQGMQDYLTQINGKSPYDANPAQDSASAYWTKERVLSLIQEQQGEARRVKMSDILALCSQRFGVTRQALFSRQRSRNISRCRHVAAYLAKNMTSKSLPEIGRDLGGLDHTSVLYALRQMARKMEDDASFRDEVEDLARRLRYGIKYEE